MAGAAVAAETGAGLPAAPGKGNRKLLLMAVPAVLAALGAGLWFSGVIPGLLAHPEPHPQAPADQPAQPAVVTPPAYVELPEIVANLNTAAHRASYIKLHARLELAQAEDAAAVQAAMPRLQDLFTTYLREMRPEELRGSAGTWRLREELIARANIAVAPGRVTDILFTEMLVQ